MQKYELSPQTHKITIVSRLKLYKILLYTARIAYENTYDMRGIFLLSMRSQSESVLYFIINTIYSKSSLRIKTAEW